MKKPKFLFKINSNNTAKIYMHKKWIKDVFFISIEGDVNGYHVELKKYARDSKGRLIIENNSIREEGDAMTIKRVRV